MTKQNWAGDLKLKAARSIIMTVMSIFNNCRVFREDMPDKDIEDAAVDFTNMVSRVLIIHITPDYIIIFRQIFGHNRRDARDLAIGFPFPWLFIVTSSCVTRGRWTLLLGYHTFCDILREAIKDAYLRVPLTADYYSFLFFFTLSLSLTCCLCRISRNMFFSFSKSLLLFRLANRCRDVVSDR